MPTETVLDKIAESHEAHERLCDLLERIADGLPHRVDPESCAAAVAMLVYDLPLHRRDHEEALFPLLRARAGPEDNIEPLLRQLHAEHVTDECGSHELVEILPLLAAGEPALDAGMCGYMLRGFFECFRRHLAWERHLILPLARRRFLAEDLEALERLVHHHHVMESGS
jgi:hemerythrin-like domain-containing protein